MSFWRYTQRNRPRQRPWNSDSFETFSLYAISPKNMGSRWKDRKWKDRQWKDRQRKDRQMKRSTNEKVDKWKDRKMKRSTNEKIEKWKDRQKKRSTIIKSKSSWLYNVLLDHIQSSNRKFWKNWFYSLIIHLEIKLSWRYKGIFIL